VKEAEFFGAPTLRVHVDHCIEMLRQVLMCSADLHLIVYDWVEQVHHPWPDFGTDHMCRDYARVHDWVEKRTAKTGSPNGLLQRPADAIFKPVPQVEY
jgi:hypothetical protein